MPEQKKRNDPWYELVGPEIVLTQGDIIPDCPLIGWKPEPIRFEGLGENRVLTTATDCFRGDVVVMTQACDLENHNVSNVVLCPCTPLTIFRQSWEEERTKSGKTIKADAWSSFCKQITNGFVWNLSMLNSYGNGSLTTENRIVEFQELYTIPRDFLESLLKERGQQRLRLLPPYREHLSQAFARFFMRVGLPMAVTPVWDKNYRQSQNS